MPWHVESAMNSEIALMPDAAPPQSTNAPAVSVIVPTRNRADLLEGTLNGVRAQSWADYEVVVIDDGSSSETRARYEQIWTSLDQRFRLIAASEAASIGCGPAAMRNLAARHAV